MTDTARADDLEVSVVLPAHNELALLGSTVTNLLTGLEERNLRYEILVVENGSNDGTLQLARVLAAQLPTLSVLSLPRGDYGAALAAGFRAARGALVVSFDVDYYDLSFLDAARALIAEGAGDLVIASKRAPGASDRRPLGRRVLTAGFATLLHAAVDLPVSDAHGMKVLRRATCAPLVSQCRLRGSLFDVELVVRAARAGLRAVEVPAAVAERRPPRSSVLTRTAESALGIIRLRRVLAHEHPGAPGGPLRRLAAGVRAAADRSGFRRRPPASSA